MALEKAMNKMVEVEEKQRCTKDAMAVQAQGDPEVGPAHDDSFGSNIEDLFDHSYQRPLRHRCVWVLKERVLEAAQIGLLASEEDVPKFGANAKRILPVKPKTLDSRSIAAVVEEEMENRGGGRGSFRGGRFDPRGGRGDPRGGGVDPRGGWDAPRGGRDEGR